MTASITNHKRDDHGSDFVEQAVGQEDGADGHKTNPGERRNTSGIVGLVDLEDLRGCGSRMGDRGGRHGAIDGASGAAAGREFLRNGRDHLVSLIRQREYGRQQLGP
jgi:hypothetical protein